MAAIDEMEMKPAQSAVRQPVAPTSEDWQRLKENWKESNDVPVVDVLVPVYRGFAETMRCLYNVLFFEQKTSYRLVVVDDCSPDAELKAAIQGLSAQGFLDLHQTRENLGFVGACNLGLALHTERDVILLNSDAEVYNDWLDRLRIAAYRTPKTASVTPFSNNATICSYPYFVKDNIESLEIEDSQLDRLAADVNAECEVDIPTGVGFCMYVRRACLAEIGFLDEENFGKGYGEENDLCMRAKAAGWRNIIAPNVFVRHYGATSFGAIKTERIKAAMKVIERLHPSYSDLVDKFVEKDPIRPFRENLDKARILCKPKDKAVLFVMHKWGAQADHYAQELLKSLAAEEGHIFFCRPTSKSASKIQIFGWRPKETPNLPIFDIKRDQNKLVDFLSQSGVSHLSVCSIDGFSDKIEKFILLACQEGRIECGIKRFCYKATLAPWDRLLTYLKELF